MPESSVRKSKAVIRKKMKGEFSMKRILSIALTAALALSLAACSGGTTSSATSSAASGGASSGAASADQPVTMKLGWAETAERSGHALSEAAYTFKEQVEALSNGSITVDLYPAAQLGDATSMLTQVEAGTLESCMSVSNGQFATSYYPDLGFLDIPFMFESSQEAYDLLNPEGEFFQDLQSDIAEKTGIRPLVFFNEGLRHITNSKHEIKTPEDLQGLKIRTMNVTAHMKMFETLGAQPTNVSWNELYTALQTGLSDAQKEAVDQAALKALEAEYDMYQANEAANLELLKEHGLQITELTSEQIDAFRQACQPQVLEYLRSTMDTPELLDEAMELVETARAAG